MHLFSRSTNICWAFVMDQALETPWWMIGHPGFEEVGGGWVRNRDLLPVEANGKHWLSQNGPPLLRTHSLDGLCSDAHTSLSFCIALFPFLPPLYNPSSSARLLTTHSETSNTWCPLIHSASATYLAFPCSHSLWILVHIITLSH